MRFLQWIALFSLTRSENGRRVEGAHDTYCQTDGSEGDGFAMDNGSQDYIACMSIFDRGLERLLKIRLIRASMSGNLESASVYLSANVRFVALKKRGD